MIPQCSYNWTPLVPYNKACFSREREFSISCRTQTYLICFNLQRTDTVSTAINKLCLQKLQLSCWKGSAGSYIIRLYALPTENLGLPSDIHTNMHIKHASENTNPHMCVMKKTQKDEHGMDSLVSGYQLESKKIMSLQSTTPKKLSNKEISKRNIQIPWEGEIDKIS